MMWNELHLLVILAFLRSCTGDEYEACTTESVRTGGVGSEANITSPMPNTHKCKMHITTCEACSIHLEIVELTMLPCNGNLPPLILGCRSQCTDFITVHEPGYEDTTTSYINNATMNFSYVSLSHRVFMQFCLSPTAKFQIKYTIKDKVEEYAGKNGESGTFTSPDFPLGYKSSGDTYKYIVNNTAKGYIRLEFPDWHMANSSKITIYHDFMDSKHFLFRSGNASRPFVKSQGSVLIILFETGPVDSTAIHSVRYLGFRARYTFNMYQEWTSKPFNYNCGNFYTLTWGGSFSFNTDICPAGEIVDCVWVVNRYPLYAFSDYIWLKIYDISLDESDTLEIRSGNNSRGTLLKKLADITSSTSDIVEIDSIYIHLRAHCKIDRYFKVAFASYDNAQLGMGPDYESYYCPFHNHFLCQNRRCISNLLKCDGVNHCKDWSDERNCKSIGPSCRSCGNGQGWYCSNDICDGTQDCLDGTDELDCNRVGSTSRPPVERNPDHYYWGTITPVVLICLILGIITCIVISYYVRRKRLLRERNRCISRSRSPGAGGNSQVIDSLGLTPPTYDESVMVQYISDQGTVNTAFDGLLDFPNHPPPPYTPKCDNSHLPMQYLPPYEQVDSHGISGTADLGFTSVSTSAADTGSISMVSMLVPAIQSGSGLQLTRSSNDNVPPARPPPPRERPQGLSMYPDAVLATLTGRKTSRSGSQSSTNSSLVHQAQTTPSSSSPERPSRTNMEPGDQCAVKSALENDNSIKKQNNETRQGRTSLADPHSTSSPLSGYATSIQCNSNNAQCDDNPKHSSQQGSQEPDELHTPQFFVPGSTVIIDETGDVFV